MPTISMNDVLADDEKRPDVINDAAALVDSEVKKKRGFGGTLIKSGYAVVKRLNKGRMIHEVLEGLLPEFVESIEPIHKEHRDGGGGAGFGKVLSDREDEATEALLGVTDKRAEKSSHKVLRKTYYKLRPRAEAHVKDALPGLGDLIDKYTVTDE